MANKKSSNALYWESQERAQLNSEYSEFLKNEGLDKSPHSAQIFAIRKRNLGHLRFSERDMILLLTGELPYMYD